MLILNFAYIFLQFVPSLVSCTNFQFQDSCRSTCSIGQHRCLEQKHKEPMNAEKALDVFIVTKER